ncbi:universal stress protein [Photobacterium japonica]|uniref:universal stress protein n=1 Tax=Photobacterium japonica TaxID=2910235 RepID=UPI003D1188BF
MKYKHVMLAVNFDGNAGFLISKAAQEAKLHHALFSVIHIDPDFSALYEGVREFDGLNNSEVQSEGVIAMTKLLSEVDYPVHKHIFYAGYVEDQIIRAIDTFEVDLLVIGHHESTIFRQLTLSASEPLLRKMPCDIQFIKLED